MPLTPMQELAVKLRGREILVSAAAGSGKTSVLSKRVISLLSGEEGAPVSADRMLIVTFTKAASAELRVKITRELEERIAIEPQNTRLLQQRRLLPQTQISTIDALCRVILRQNFEKAKLSPDFSIIQGGALAELESAVLDEVIEEAYSQEDEGFTALRSILENNSDERIRACILDVYHTCRAEPDAKAWMDASLRYIQKAAEDSLTEYQRLIGGLQKGCQDIARKLPDLAAAMRFIADRTEHPKRKTRDFDSKAQQRALSVALYQRALDKLEEAAQAARGSFDPDSMKNALQSLPKLTIKDYGLIRKEPELAEVNDCFAAFEAIKKQLLEVRVPHAERDRVVLLATEKAYALTRRLLEKLDLRKEERSLLDFADLQQRTVALLCDTTLHEDGSLCFSPTETARKLAESYDCVMVDECQDNNRAQDVIFRMLTYGKNDLFYVGDVKQSIYRFRHAKPELFTDRLAQSELITPESALSGKKPAAIVLSDNFRSRKSVIEAVNYLFARVMSVRTGELTYDAAAAMHAGFPYPPLPGGFSDAAELHLLDQREGKDLPKQPPIDQARYVAALIASMVREGFPVTDRDTKTLRRCRFSDFMLLMRSRSRLTDYLKALEEYHISYRTAGIKAFYETSEISACLSLLKVCGNPKDDLALWSYLLSPFCGFDFDDAASLRIHANGIGAASVYDALLSAASTPDALIGAKAQKALSTLSDLSDALMKNSLSHFLRYAFETTGFASILSSTEDGAQKRANLDLFIKDAASWENENFGGADGYLAYVEKLLELNEDIEPASALLQSDDVVQVMTIHGSKGLEAPICILTSCEVKFNNAELQSGYLLHPTHGLALPYCSEEECIRVYNAFGEQVKTQLSSAMRSEELRLLYVALTRAREKLICVGEVKNLQGTLEKLSKDYLKATEHMDCRVVPNELTETASSFLSWLLPGFLTLPSCVQTLQSYDYPTLPVMPYDAVSTLFGPEEKTALPFSLMLRRAGEYSENALDPADAPSVTQRENAFNGEEALAWMTKPYPFEAVTELPAKASVTALSHGEGERFDRRRQTEEERRIDYYEDIFTDAFSDSGDRAWDPDNLDNLQNITELFLPKDKPTAALRGTATHAFLQYADFEAARADFEKELSRLVQSAFLRADERELIEQNEVIQFLHSRICERILTAQKENRLLREYAFIHELPAALLEKEIPSCCDAERIIVQGIADCILLESDGLIVIDYKTDRLRSEAQFVTRYQKQLDIYEDALNALFADLFPNKKAVKEKLIYSLFLGREIRIK